MPTSYQNMGDFIGNTEEQAVEALLFFTWTQKVPAYVMFEEEAIFSDDVQNSTKYKELVDKTKKRFNEREAKNEQLIAEYEAKLERIQEMKEKWMEKGKEVLDEEHWESWECVLDLRITGKNEDSLDLALTNALKMYQYM